MGTLPSTRNLRRTEEISPPGPMVPCFCVPDCIPDDAAERLAARGSDILVLGEPGVGKRFFAQYVHSRRYQDRRGMFVEITPAVSDEELKVILFEEERKRVEGMLGRPIPALSEGSMLFVHHIHSLSSVNQSRIARFLIQNELAGPRRKIHLSIIISIRHPWATLIEQKSVVEPLDKYIRKFDLFSIPPLRERQECIPFLVKSFLAELGRKELMVDKDGMGKLKKHYWRDNVRELRLVVEEAVVRSQDGSLTLPEELLDEVEYVENVSRMIQAGKRLSVEHALDFLEKTIIQRTLMQCNYDPAVAARRLELTEKNLMYRIRKYDVYFPRNARRRT